MIKQKPKRNLIMERINEEKAAKVFMERLTNGYYLYDRSQNNEVNYSKEKEQRDTQSVRAFLNSKLFGDLKNI